jgi:muramoyltetrapeptide carboxypeptidase
MSGRDQISFNRREFIKAAGAALLASGAISSGCGTSSENTSNSVIRFPQPLKPGDIIGVTSPSAGVSPEIKPRMDFCYDYLRSLGFQIVEGNCLWRDSIFSAPAQVRAAEFQAMLLDDSISAIFPPDGGELLIDILPLIDFVKLKHSRPKWIIGYSDMSTFMFPYTLITRTATMNGSNLWESPVNPTDAKLSHWSSVAGLEPGTSFIQHEASLYQPHDTDWEEIPYDTTSFDRTTPVSWKLLNHETNADATVMASGRLIGGTLDVIGMLCGSGFNNIGSLIESFASEGLIFYLDNCDFNTAQYCRMLHHLRLAGWFEKACAILIGRTLAENVQDLDQRGALIDALGNLSIPVIYDMDIGHLPPQLILVNGARAEIRFSTGEKSIVQWLC